MAALTFWYGCNVVRHADLIHAAIALLEHTDLAPADIVKKSLEIAGDICIYTNQNHVVETL